MKKTTKTLAIALGTGSLLIGGVAIAQSPMAQADMTRDAVIAKTNERFAKMDVNGDGVLSEADREAKAKEHFAKLDTNGDGMLSEAEFLAAREARMEERQERREARKERRGGDRMAHRGGRGHHGGPEGGPRGGMHMLKMADTNQDGQITKAEFQAAALTRFDKADADGDGTVTREERKAAHEAMRAQRGQRDAE